MFSSSYYALVAGLREYSLDTETKGFDIEEILAEVEEALSTSDMKVVELLLEVAKNWNGAAEQTSLKALLPAAKESEFAKVFEASAKQLLAAGVEVGYSKDVKSGFKVGEKDGGYYIAFTDESFEALFDEYLREKVSQLLFA